MEKRQWNESMSQLWEMCQSIYEEDAEDPHIISVMKLLYISSIFASQINQPDFNGTDCMVKSQHFVNPEIENVRELKVAHQRDDFQKLHECLNKDQLGEYETMLTENQKQWRKETLRIVLRIIAYENLGENDIVAG